MPSRFLKVSIDGSVIDNLQFFPVPITIPQTTNPVGVQLENVWNKYSHVPLLLCFLAH